MWIDDLKAEKLNNKLKTAIIFVLIWSAFPANWSCIAVLAIFQINKYRGNLPKQTISMMEWVMVYAIVSFFFVNKAYGVVCLGVILVYPFLRMYNGERGKTKWLKENLNQYDVIKINMQEFLSMTDTIEEMLEMLKNYLVSDFEETYPTVRFRDKKNLIQVMKDVFSYTKCPFVILIDGWDCLFREYKQDNEAQKKYETMKKSL